MFKEPGNLTYSIIFRILVFSPLALLIFLVCPPSSAALPSMSLPEKRKIPKGGF